MSDVFYPDEYSKVGRKSKGLKVNDTNITYIIKQEVLSKYEKIFDSNTNRIIAVIKNHISKISSKLGTRSPTVRIPFTDSDKLALFRAAGIDRKVLEDAVVSISSKDIDTRNNVIKDPFNLLCSILISHYYNRDTNRNNTNRKKLYDKPYYYLSLFLAIKFYCFLYVRSFQKADPNPDVMDYTFESLSNKHLFKKMNNVYDVIRYFSETIIDNMEDRIIRGADVDYVYVSLNLYNRLSNTMKTLVRKFYENKAKMNKTGTDKSSMTDEEGDFYVGSTSNISSNIDTAVRKILNYFVSETTIDSHLVEVACSKTKYSKAKMILILQKIRERNDPLLKTILSNIISYYLISTKKPITSIRSVDFVTTMIKLYTVSNTKNKTIIAIKDDLSKLILSNASDILKEGNTNGVDRVKNALYVYLVLFITKHIE